MKMNPIYDSMLDEGYTHTNNLQSDIAAAATWEPKGPEDDHWGMDTEPQVDGTGVADGADRGRPDGDDETAVVPPKRGAGGSRRGAPRRTPAKVGKNPAPDGKAVADRSHVDGSDTTPDVSPTPQEA